MKGYSQSTLDSIFLKEKKDDAGKSSCAKLNKDDNPRSNHEEYNIDDNPRSNHVEYNIEDLPTDPGLRILILSYPHSLRDEVRRPYLQRGPCQPRGHDFPKKLFGSNYRRFNPALFDKYENWLEYSINKDAIFCLCCYLFKTSVGDQAGGDSFVGEVFSNWKKIDRLRNHVGGPSSAHNQAWSSCEDLMNQKQHIRTTLEKQSDQNRNEYRESLTATIDCVRFLLRQGIAFRGNKESKNSRNQGNFLELLKFLADHNKEIDSFVLDKAPGHSKLISPKVQKEITNVAAGEVINVNVKEIGDSLFYILVDEFRDISMKEQMAIVLRYVDQNGNVIERFVGIEHVVSTTAISLKEAIDKFFSRHGLSISRLRGQGYDGATNMQGEFNGLKSLILKENPCAFYIHCFAHQLQLCLVAMAKKNLHIASFFLFVTSVVNVVGGSSKRRDILQEKQATVIDEALKSGENESGRGKNQQTTLKRCGDTRWGSHHGTLISLISMFSPVIKVLETIVDEGSTSDQKCEAHNLLVVMQSFDFVFALHLMKNLLGITNELSKALQRKDQDIANAMTLVKICKQRLQTTRDNGWDSLFEKVFDFCTKHNIEIPNMNGMFTSQGRSRRNVQKVTNLHYFRVELFYSVVDLQLQELNDRFTEANTELLLCVTCLYPDNLFFAFDKQKLLRLARYYPSDFSSANLIELDNQLETYILDMRSSKEFDRLKGIGDLAKKMVETKKNKVYPLVYLLITLALILPVATANVERVFSTMNVVKTHLRNRMGDQWMNDNLITYIKKDIFNSIDNEVIIQKYQNKKTRREQL